MARRRLHVKQKRTSVTSSHSHVSFFVSLQFVQCAHLLSFPLLHYSPMLLPLSQAINQKLALPASLSRGPSPRLPSPLHVSLTEPLLLLVVLNGYAYFSSVCKNHPPNSVNRRDAICSDPSNSRQGHGSLSAIRQGRRGAKGGKSRKVSWHYSSLVCRALTGRLGRLHRLDLKWAMSPLPPTPNSQRMCKHTPVYKHTHALDGTSCMMRGQVF